MAGQLESTRGIILAGVYPWANSAFDQLLLRPLLPVAHKPLISYGLSWLWKAGVSSVTVCGNRDTRALPGWLAQHIPDGMAVSYREDPMPRGAAGSARDAADGEACHTYVVTDGTTVPAAVDLPQVLARHRTSGAIVTVVVYAQPGRGASPVALEPVGIYVVDRAAFDAIPPRGFVDFKEHLIPRLYRTGMRVLPYEIARAVPRVLNARTYLAVNGMAVESVVTGAATPAGYVRRGEALIHADARVAGDAVLAGPLLIGQGARIHAGAVVVGPTSIGCDAIVNDGALVSRSAVWRRSAVPAGATIDLGILGDGAVLANGNGPHVGTARDHRVPHGARQPRVE